MEATKKLVVSNLLDIVDIDEGVSGKKEVPVNCIYTGANEIQKDTGCELFNENGDDIITSLFSYKKQNGNEFLLRTIGTKLQYYNNGNWTDLKENLTDGKMMGYKVYDDVLYMANGVDALMSWDGSGNVQVHTGKPTGNILEIFEDRLFIAGNETYPLSLYYSEPGEPLNFPTANVVKPPGTDKITGLVKYYNYLIIFKEKSTWRLQFVYEPNSQLYIPKIDVISSNYGCVSKKGYCWVENDVWFFTGKEVRRIAWLTSMFGGGVVGFDPISLSNQIKDGLAKINENFADRAVAFYHQNRFYLSVPLGADEVNNTTYICHILYKNNWTKLVDRVKARMYCVTIYQDKVYFSTLTEKGKIYKWTDGYNDNGEPIKSYAVFKQIGEQDFLKTLIFKSLDLEFKNIETICDVELIIDDFDERWKKTKSFSIVVENDGMENTIGEVVVGQIFVGDGYGEEIEPTEYVKRRIYFLDKGNTLKIKVGNNSLKNFVISRLGLEYKARDRRYIQPSKTFNIS